MRRTGPFIMILAGLGLMSLGMCQPAGAQTSSITLDRSTFGCLAISDRQAFLEITRQKDTTAMRKFMTEREEANACLLLSKGTKVFLMTYRTIERQTYGCFRPEGETFCLWEWTGSE